MALKISNFDKVIHFNSTLMPGSVPTGMRETPTHELKLQLLKLIAEELVETSEALGIDMLITIAEGKEVYATRDTSFAYNRIEAADGLGDILVTVYGAAARLGLPINEVFNEIHKSNMSKVNADGTVTLIDGKIQKPSHFKKPDIQKVLDNYESDPDMSMSDIVNKSY